MMDADRFQELNQLRHAFQTGALKRETPVGEQAFQRWCELHQEWADTPSRSTITARKNKELGRLRSVIERQRRARSTSSVSVRRRSRAGV